MLRRAAGIVVAAVVLAAGVEFGFRGYAAWRLASRPEGEQVAAEHGELGDYVRYDPYLIFRAIPGSGGRFTRFNRLGFRGKDIAIAKRPSALRVAVLGGSAAFGWGVRDEETFSARLEERLGNAEVVNAGLPGYFSTQEVILLQLHLLVLEPDLVIVFDGLNDLYYAMAPTWHRHLNLVAAPLQLRWERGPWAGLLVDVLSRSRLLSHLRARPGLTTGAGAPLPASESEGIRIYADNLLTMLAALDARGIPAIVVVQPTLLWTPKPLSVEERQQMDGLRGIPAYREASRELARLHPLLLGAARRVAAPFRVPVTDLADLPWPAETCFIDPVHYNAAGNRLIADGLAALVTARRAR